jgi:hypothetical protein
MICIHFIFGIGYYILINGKYVWLEYRVCMRALSMPGHNIIASKLQMSAATSFDSGNGVDLAGHQLVDNQSLCIFIVLH